MCAVSSAGCTLEICGGIKRWRRAEGMCVASDGHRTERGEPHFVQKAWGRKGIRKMELWRCDAGVGTLPQRDLEACCGCRDV